jgi:hypothetical protein
MEAQVNGTIKGLITVRSLTHEDEIKVQIGSLSCSQEEELGSF